MQQTAQDRGARRLDAVMFYIDDLDGTTCQCGRPKKSRKSFCGSCYAALPMELRRSLYRRIGAGYEAAFDSAAIWLRENT